MWTPTPKLLALWADPQCWPFRQQPVNRLQSHPKQLWGAVESGFCKQKRDITTPLAFNKYKSYNAELLHSLI